MEYISFAAIAEELAELEVTVEDVELIAQIECANYMFDEDMDGVTPEGRDAIVTHLYGGKDPELPSPGP